MIFTNRYDSESIDLHSVYIGKMQIFSAIFFILCLPSSGYNPVYFLVDMVDILLLFYLLTLVNSIF